MPLLFPSKEVVIMGGGEIVEDPIDGCTLVPDTSHNQQFDKEVRDKPWGRKTIGTQQKRINIKLGFWFSLFFYLFKVLFSFTILQICETTFYVDFLYVFFFCASNGHTRETISRYKRNNRQFETFGLTYRTYGC